MKNSAKKKIADREAAFAAEKAVWLQKLVNFSNTGGSEVMSAELRRECGRFGYDRCNYVCEINGYSVKTEGDQDFQLACSILQNESDTAKGE